MKEFVEKLIERLEKELGNTNFEKATEEVNDSFYEGLAFAYGDSIRIVNQLAEEYMTCYKSCTECEAYDKERHYCPKFCYIIAETVKEIEENHNGWIPVTEKLPEESLNSVIGWDEHRKRCCFVQYYGGRWVLGNDVESVKITAWRNLPEPYEREVVVK